MLGLKRGTVELLPHEISWEENAVSTITLLKSLLGTVALDIQHVGSTAIRHIHAKPIIDIALGVKNLDDIKPYISLLEKHGIIYRKEDVEQQLLFVIGNFEKEIRTHHIHVVEWNGPAWKDYINFRDYLNAFPEQAERYDVLKRQLAVEYALDRGRYTAGKKELIDELLKEARYWRCLNRKVEASKNTKSKRLYSTGVE